MNRCRGCGNEFRKGTIALLLTDKGLKGSRVCQSCASGGVLIVAPKLGPVVQKKVVRVDGVNEVLRILRNYVVAARNAANQLESRRESTQLESSRYSHFIGRAEGLESAISALETTVSR